jgi:hypothetical protein
MPQKEEFTGIELEFHSGVIPPPYSHMYRISLDWSTGNLNAKLDLHYTEREELTEDEILDEGFTLDDDFSYSGSLNNIWIKALTDKVNDTKWTGKSIDDAGIILKLNDSGKVGKVKVPVNQEEWQVFGQDIIQAIYETTKKEAPLTIHYREVDTENIKDCSITIRFSDREVIFSQNNKEKNINWEYTVLLMKLIFTPDYNYEIAKEEPGKKRGSYIECGDGLWHELGKGVVNIDTSNDVVTKIKEIFSDLLEE